MIPFNLQPTLYLIAFLALILASDALLDYLLRHSFIGSRYRLFIAPGIIVHELSHALAASLTGSQIKKISLFAPQGGYVIHASQPGLLQPFRLIIVSLAPLFGVTLSFFILTLLLQPDWLSNININHPYAILTSLPQLSLSKWQSWLYLYLTLSLAAALAPSWQDIFVALPGLILIILTLLILSLTRLLPYILNLFHFFQPLFLILISFLILAVSLSAVIYLISLGLNHIQNSR